MRPASSRTSTTSSTASCEACITAAGILTAGLLPHFLTVTFMRMPSCPGVDTLYLQHNPCALMCQQCIYSPWGNGKEGGKCNVGLRMKCFALLHHGKNHFHPLCSSFRLLCRFKAIDNRVNIRFVECLEKRLRLFIFTQLLKKIFWWSRIPG